MGLVTSYRSRWTSTDIRIERQVRPWVGHGVRSPEALSRVVEGRASAFLFRVADNVVHCDYKSGGGTDLILAQRAQFYHHFLNDVVARFPLPDMSFALDVGDEARESPDVPIFSFQREVGSRNLLLPDIDFLWYGFYADEAKWGLPDRACYVEKAASACFVGSLTGAGHVTKAKLDAGGVPRVEAARFFRGNPDVDFSLANLVQCTEEAAESLRSEGLVGAWKSWPEQLRHRFVLSMDGNGATCSRVYVALASNCVLLKYASGNEMFYFPEMEAGVHYLPVERHEDVLGFVEEERRSPGKYAAMARRSGDLAARYLRRGALEAYAADLLWAYSVAG